MDGDTDMLDMVNSFSSRAVATCANLGTVQIKGLKDLVCCIHDFQTNNQPLIAAEIEQYANRTATTGNRVEEERSETEAKVISISKFKAEDFEAADDGFHNLLSHKKGTPKAKLRYIISDRFVPAVFPDVATERMY